MKLKERDSIYDILKKQYYTTNTTSFLALHYIYYSLMCNNSVANKEAMWPIFLKLDNKLYSYALYQQTKELSFNLLEHFLESLQILLTKPILIPRSLSCLLALFRV